MSEATNVTNYLATPLVNKYIKLTSFLEANSMAPYLSTTYSPSELDKGLQKDYFKELFTRDYTVYIPAEGLTIGRLLFKHKVYTKKVLRKKVLVKEKKVYLYRIIRRDFMDIFVLELPEELKQLIGETNES